MAARCRKDRAALEELPGVGRKTANVVLNVAFGEPTIAVDTHIFRVSNRTGLAPGKDVLAVELRLEKMRAGEIPAARASLADPARPLHLRGAQAAVPDLRGARPVPLQGQDQRTAGGEAEGAFEKETARAPRTETGWPACAARSGTTCPAGVRLAVRQGLDMAHGQRRAIEEEEGPARLPVIAPQFGGAVLAHEAGLAEGAPAGRRPAG